VLFQNKKNENHLKNLDLYKLGSNLFASEKPENLQFNHSASCNGCGGGFDNSPRFICLSCRPGAMVSGGFADYNGKCVSTLKDPKNPEYANVKDRYPEHDHETHVYLRLVFDCKGYYNY